MNYIRELTLKDGSQFRVYQDQDPDSPREWDNLGQMVMSHRRYNLPNELKVSMDSIEGWDDLEQKLKSDYDARIVIPVFMYDHSGISLNCDGLVDRWDSSRVGFIVATKKKIMDEFGNCDKATIEKVRKILRAEVSTYSQYLSGEVYGFELIKKKSCKCCGHESEETIDSCNGFYGWDIKTNGMLDNIEKKIKKEIEAML